MDENTREVLFLAITGGYAAISAWQLARTARVQRAVEVVATDVKVVRENTNGLTADLLRALGEAAEARGFARAEAAGRARLAERAIGAAEVTQSPAPVAPLGP